MDSISSGVLMGMLTGKKEISTRRLGVRSKNWKTPEAGFRSFSSKFGLVGR
jgi:hypothetical protein